MDQQMEVLNKPFFFFNGDRNKRLKDTKTQLNVTETQVKILGILRDYIKLILILKVERELVRVNGMKRKKCSRVLRNQDLNEMMNKSNKAFHDNEKSIEQAKTLLKEQFPDDLQKYKGPLSKVLNVLDKK
ncbi:hypothetical protein RCL_jg6669.t1 [Rhizophagus clarus]|uniref:Uncharacterized protein n=1 Tax=Rhizophagus clarus TaxID=94130 RepID=A0A8H3QNI7_9GLOM|nr:hypothetical protein RCL_jg6669.t1 [Rhizophagus clarus]